MKVPILSRISDVASLLLLAAVLYSSQPEKHTEPMPQPQLHQPKPSPPVTLAALDTPAQVTYFDLIVETTECLGENLWIGGKVVSLPAHGSERPHFALQDLTAAGLNTYSYYKLRNTSGALKVASDKKGNLYLQLQDGQMQLQPVSGETITVAYQRNLPEPVYQTETAGNWICK